MVQFVDPRPSEVSKPAPGARPAIDRSRRTTVGLLANGYPDSAEFLGLIGSALARLTGCTTVAVTKVAPPVPLDESQLAALGSCRAVVAAYGH